MCGTTETRDKRNTRPYTQFSLFGKHFKRWPECLNVKMKYTHQVGICIVWQEALCVTVSKVENIWFDLQPNCNPQNVINFSVFNGPVRWLFFLFFFFFCFHLPLLLLLLRFLLLSSLVLFDYFISSFIQLLSCRAVYDIFYMMEIRVVDSVFCIFSFTNIYTYKIFIFTPKNFSIVTHRNRKW